MRTGALLITWICGLMVVGCVAPSGTNLRGAREACHREYPRRVGNYVPHARCVNAAIETYAVPTARHPDLIRLQEQVRVSLSERIDNQRISIQAGERSMEEADRLLAAAERERDAGNEAAAREQVATIEQILGRQGAPSDFITAIGASRAFSPSHAEIPLGMSGGVFTVPVLINGAIKLDFLLDTGAADVSIPEDVIRTLIRTGSIAERDVTGTGRYVLADGSVKDNIQLRLRELKIGDRTIRNVEASVAPMQAKLLLGQTFLSRFGSWTIDNRRRVLVLAQ